MTGTPCEQPSQPLWRTAGWLSGLQLALHIIAAVAARDPRVMLPHAVAWLHDLALLWAVAGLFAAVTMARVGTRPGAAVAMGRLVLVALGALLAIYPRTLQSFLAAPVNLLEADADTASGFVRDYLGIRALWPAAVALCVGVVASRIGVVRVGRRWSLAGIPLALLAVLALGRDSPNPLVFSLQDRVRQQFAPRLVPRLKVAATRPSPLLRPVTVDWGLAARTVRYDHLLLVVLEGVTATQFEARSQGRPGTFFDQHRHRARYFSRYHSTNLDSYTSLVAMTTSVQVPFRAYAAPERYGAVNDAPNLPRGLRAERFRTLFVSTYEHQPFVPNPGDWDQVLDRRDLGDLGSWVSLGSNRMEAATEDRAALSTIVDFVTSSPRNLVLAELVFGHSPEWRARTGLEPVEYVDGYLVDLWERLTRAGLAARTLLVVVSDHGDRSRAAVAENYRVPLLVVGDAVEPGVDDQLRSHLDLQPIIAHFLSGTGMPPPRTAVLVVGSTERWVYGELRGDGAYGFVDDGSGMVLAGTIAAAAVHDAFQAHVTAFSSSF